MVAEQTSLAWPPHGLVEEGWSATCALANEMVESAEVRKGHRVVGVHVEAGTSGEVKAEGGGCPLTLARGIEVHHPLATLGVICGGLRDGRSAVGKEEEAEEAGFRVHDPYLTLQPYCLVSGCSTGRPAATSSMADAT